MTLTRCCVGDEAKHRCIMGWSLELWCMLIERANPARLRGIHDEGVYDFWAGRQRLVPWQSPQWVQSSHRRCGGRAVMLKLEKLRDARNCTGTVGTPGTVNVCADSSVPSLFTLPRKSGNRYSGGANLFPAFPVAPSTREYEISSIYTAVPAVPIVPSEKHAVMLDRHARDPLAGDPGRAMSSFSAVPLPTIVSFPV